MIRNPDWYNLNEQRSWPLAGTSTAVDDAGVYLPNDVLADLYITFPTNVGGSLFVGSVTVGSAVASITILADTGGYTPVAAVSVASPIKHKLYPLEQLYPGVSGWVVFGSGCDGETKSYKFSSATQSRIQDKSCRKYRSKPVVSLRKLGVAGGLAGDVRLSGGNDFEIVKEFVEINSVLTEVCTFRLRAEQELSDRNVFEEYAGDCVKRAESRNCGDPQPIEFINNVGPDCCGTVTLELLGCAAISNLSTNNGAVIDCGFGLSEACVTKEKLPDSTGKLPNEYDDDCPIYSVSIFVSEEAGPTEPTYSPLSAGPGQNITSLPVEVYFDGETLGDLVVSDGSVSYTVGATTKDGAVFNGSTSEIALTSSITLATTTVWRLEGWHKKGTNSTIIGGVSDEITFAGTNVWVKDNTSPVDASSELPSDGTWFHFSIRKDAAGSGDVDVYINDVFVGTKTIASPVVVNKIGSGPTYKANGTIKGLRLVNDGTEYEWPLTTNSDDLASGNDGSDTAVTYAVTTHDILTTDVASGRNIVIFGDSSFVALPEWTTFNKEFEIDFKIEQTTAGGQVNAGLCVNHRASDFNADRDSFVLVELSLSGLPQLKIRKYTGTNYITQSTTNVTGASVGNTYRIRTLVEPVAADDDGAWLTVWLLGLDDSVYVKTSPVYVDNYRSAVGSVGLFSHMSSSNFTRLYARNQP